MCDGGDFVQILLSHSMRSHSLERETFQILKMAVSETVKVIE